MRRRKHWDRLLRTLLASVFTWIAPVFQWAGHRYTLRPQDLALERVTVPIPGLPDHLSGFTIGVLADLHLGPLVRAAEIRKAAAALAAEHPHLVLVAGDLVTAPEYAAQLAEALSPIAGAYGVLGNWDYRFDAATGVRAQPHVRILVNEGVLVAPGLWLAGLDDAQYGEPDLKRALAGAPRDAVRLLLAHEPDVADWVRPAHRIALQISGHSHGGQIRLLGRPLMLPPLGRKYHTGLYQAPACPVYTSRGVGVAHLPLRLFCPPEITLLTLQRG